MKKIFSLPVFYFISAILIEVLTFIVLDIGILPKYIFIDLTVLFFIFCFLVLVHNSVAQLILTLFFLLIQVAFGYINYLLYIQFGDVITIEMFRLISDARDAMTSDFVNFSILLICILIFSIMTFTAISIYKKIKNIKLKKTKRFATIFALLFIVAQIGSITGYLYNRQFITAQAYITEDSYIESDRFVIDSPILKIKAYRTLGTFGFLVNNFYTAFFESRKSNDELAEIAIDYLQNDSTPIYSEYFGSASDQNVLILMVESLDQFAISEELTPNICSVLADSGYAQSYFSKSKTNLSENCAILGSNPIILNLQILAGEDYDKSSNAYGFSLPSILSENGYSANYFHSYSSRFYNRKYVQNNIGFDNSYFCQDVYGDDYPFFQWKSEEEYVEAMIDNMIPTDEKFFTFYTSVGMHGGYETNSKNYDQTLYHDIVANSDYFNQLKTEHPEFSSDTCTYLNNYLANTVGFDRALGVIVNKLKSENLYDNTTIIMFGDHCAYYNELTYSVKNIPPENYWDFDANVVPFIIKCSAIDKEKINNMQSTIYSADIVPTILDLVGIEYNKNLYLGSSIFNYTNEYSQRVTYSFTGGLFSEKYYTLDLVEFHKFDETATEIDLSDFKQKANEILRKVYYLNCLYKNYLYSDL